MAISQNNREVIRVPEMTNFERFNTKNLLAEHMNSLAIEAGTFYGSFVIIRKGIDTYTVFDSVPNKAFTGGTNDTIEWIWVNK